MTDEEGDDYTSSLYDAQGDMTNDFMEEGAEDQIKERIIDEIGSYLGLKPEDIFIEKYDIVEGIED